MWVIFLLAALSVAIVALIIVYIAHKVIMAIEKDREKTNNNKEKGEKDYE